MNPLYSLCMLLCISTATAAEFSPLPESGPINKAPKAEVPFDLDQLKELWRTRIQTIVQDGKLPIIDIESSFNLGKLNGQTYARSMDQNGIALTAFSAQSGEKKYRTQGQIWHDGARRAVGADPTRFIPTTTAGIYPVFTENPVRFVQQTIRHVEEENYPLMGEFEFRHYMSPRQYRRNETERDVSLAIDSEAAHLLFAFSQRSGIPFQIHYEVEDPLLPPLEKMLASYPDAKVIWCHLGQVRYATRAKNYSATYIRSLIEKYPHIYFDLAFGDADSIYPGSDEYHARVWEKYGKVKQEWVDLIVDHPYRFLAALDIGGDRSGQLNKHAANLRTFLNNLPKQTQQIVAYKAAWKLLFDEEL